MCWLLGLSEYIAMFELRRKFPNIWTELVGSSQVSIDSFFYSVAVCLIDSVYDVRKASSN